MILKIASDLKCNYLWYGSWSDLWRCFSSRASRAAVNSWSDKSGWMLASLTLLDHLPASSWSCLAATIIGSLTMSPAFCSGNSSSFSSGGGGLGGGTSPSGRGGLGGAASSLSYEGKVVLTVEESSLCYLNDHHQSCSCVRTYTQLVQFRRRWWWEVWFLGLEGFPDLWYSTENLIAWVQKAFLNTWW